MRLFITIFCSLFFSSQIALAKEQTKKQALLYYNQEISNWPAEAKEKFSILLDMMKKDRLPIFYPQELKNSSPVHPDNKGANNFSTLNMDMEFFIKPERQKIKSARGNQLYVLNDADTEINDSWDNDIVFSGKGNDIIDVGWGQDVIVFEKDWGQDTVKKTCHRAKYNSDFFKDSIGKENWKKYGYNLNNFIIFGSEIKPENLQWDLLGTLKHKDTGDSIIGANSCFNIVFYEGGKLQSYSEFRDIETKKFQEKVKKYNEEKGKSAKREPKPYIEKEPELGDEMKEHVAMIDACIKFPKSSCIYETLIKGFLDIGIQLVNFHHTQERMDMVDDVIEMLIGLKEYKIAENYALRAMVQRENFTAVTPNSKIYTFYKQAKNQERISFPFEQKEERIFKKSFSAGNRNRKYFEENCYEPLKKQEFDKAQECVDGISFSEHLHSNGSPTFNLKTSHGSIGGTARAREYLDFLYEIIIEYAKHQKYENVRSNINLLEDGFFMGKLSGNIVKVGLIKDKNTPVPPENKKHDRTFEFLDVMIGAGAGTDKSVFKISSLVDKAKNHHQKGNESLANVALNEAYKLASNTLANPSLSYSKALLILSNGYASIGRYKDAFKLAEETFVVCCTTHPKERRLIQDKRHYEWAWSGIVTGAIENKNFKIAKEAAEKIKTPVEKALVYVEISQALQMTGNKVESYEYAQKVEEFANIPNNLDALPENKFKFPEEKAHFLNLISDIYFDIGKIDEAKRVLDKAVEVYFPEASSIQRGSSMSHGRKAQFNPLNDIIYNYVDQGREKEITKKLEFLGRTENSQRTQFLFKAALKATKNKDIEAMDYLLNETNSYMKKLDSRIKTSHYDLVTKGKIKQGDANKGIEKSVKRETRRFEQQTSDYLTDIALELVVSKDQVSKARELFSLAIQAQTKIETYSTDIYGNQPTFNYLIAPEKLAKLEIVKALLNEQNKLNENAFEDILFSIRSTQQGSGYGFNSKKKELATVSELLYKYGFKDQAKTTLDLARLMADRISSRFTRHTVPINSKQLSAAYTQLAKIHLGRGNIAEVEDLEDAMNNRSNRVKIEGDDRSVYLMKQRLYTDLFLILKETDEIELSNHVKSKITHPFYKLIVQDPLPEIAPSFGDVVKHSWDDEEIILTIPYILKLCEKFYQNKNIYSYEQTLGYALKVANSFKFRYRGAQSFILISDFYKQIGEKEKSIEALERAKNYIGRARQQKQELQGLIAERFSILHENNDVALSGLQGEAAVLLGSFSNNYKKHRSPGRDKYHKLISIAYSMAKLDNGILPETEARIINYLNKKPVLKLLQRQYKIIDSSCGLQNLTKNAQFHVIIPERSSIERVVNHDPALATMIVEQSKVKIKKSSTPLILFLPRNVQWVIETEKPSPLIGIVKGDDRIPVKGIEDLNIPIVPVYYSHGDYWQKQKCSFSLLLSGNPYEPWKKADHTVFYLNKMLKQYAGQDVDHIYFSANDNGDFVVQALNSEQLKKKEQFKNRSVSSKKLLSVKERGLEIASILEMAEAGEGRKNIRDFTNDDKTIAKEWLNGAQARFRKYTEKYDLLNSLDLTFGSGQGMTLKQFFEFEGESDAYNIGITRKNSRKKTLSPIYVIEGPAIIDRVGVYFVKSDAPRPVGKNNVFYLDDFTCYSPEQEGYCQRYQDSQ